MFGQHQHWIGLALASGACAAFNGVFAKLTTTEMTSGLASRLSVGMGLAKDNHVVEYGLRAVFFAFNLIFNGIMWALFTGALARGTSTTQVSIVNVSANFMFTAVLGFMIFTESLPPLWWLGAALLVAGTVIVGRRDEDQKSSGEGSQPPSPSSPRHTFVRTVEPRRGQPEGKALLQEGDDDGHEEVELVTDVGRASR